MNGKLQALYDLAEREQIHIDRRQLRCRASLSLVTSDRKRYIAIDFERTKTPRREKYVVAHELGHHLVADAMYTGKTSYEDRSRCEFRADRWAIEHLLPFEQIRDAMRRGYTEPWELAEELYEDEELVRKALWYYTEVCGLDFNDFTTDNPNSNGL